MLIAQAVMSEEELAALNVIVRFGMLGIAVVVALLLGALGVFSEAAFRRAPGREGRLKVGDAMIAVGMGFGGALIGSLIAVGMGAAPDMPQGLLIVMLSAQLGVVPAIGFLLVRAAIDCRNGIVGFGLNYARPLRTTGLTLLVLLIVFVLITGYSFAVDTVAQLLEIELPAIAHTTLEALYQTDQPWVKWGIVFSAVVLAPLFEEPIYRGMVQTALRQGGPFEGRWAVILLATVIFVAMHITAVPWYALGSLVILSLGLGYLYERTGSLIAPILAHALFNALNVAAVLSGAV